MGHEDPFPRRRANGWCRFSEETFRRDADNGAELIEIGYADKVRDSRVGLGRRALGCLRLLVPLPFAFAKAIWVIVQTAGRGDAGLEICREIRQMWASTSSHADCPEAR